MSKQIDRKDSKIIDSLITSPIYKKYGNVKAKPAIVGEKITTVLESGAKETTNTANEGDWVVTNPGGEQYIISGKKFLGRYEATSEDGIYSAKGYCRAITNPFNEAIEIMASWGELQNGDDKCMIADVCDASGKSDGEPYIIEKTAFENTYKQINKG
jgi:hypothetical protein